MTFTALTVAHYPSSLAPKECNIKIQNIYSCYVVVMGYVITDKINIILCFTNPNCAPKLKYLGTDMTLDIQFEKQGSLMEKLLHVDRKKKAAVVHFI